ncbi:MAG: hypothetical protein NVSMB67_23680 [Flavisolibacter sp.]
MMTRILVIDDDPDIRALMQLSFKKRGYVVETAAKKEEALEKLDKFSPDIILLDVLLSGADGRDVCKEIKAKKETEKLPIIMVSAHPGAIENIAHYGADDFIAKPFNMDALLIKMEKLLNRQA